ncbi:hypothetical protein BGX24_009560 [Mortierella sp. AD032]|nr:hypothetical protein BGX24_009560 [Mortierella sp. AD032]
MVEGARAMSAELVAVNTYRWAMGNIVESWKSQFTKKSSSNIGKYSEYDIYSIMHYANRHPIWSINNRPGFTSKRLNVDYYKIGNGNDFAKSDALAIRRMYKCPERKFTTAVNNNTATMAARIENP